MGYCIDVDLKVFVPVFDTHEFYRGCPQSYRYVETERIRESACNRDVGWQVQRIGFQMRKQ